MRQKYIELKKKVLLLSEKKKRKKNERLLYLYKVHFIFCQHYSNRLRESSYLHVYSHIIVIALFLGLAPNTGKERTAAQLTSSQVIYEHEPNMCPSDSSGSLQILNSLCALSVIFKCQPLQWETPILSKWDTALSHFYSDRMFYSQKSHAVRWDKDIFKTETHYRLNKVICLICNVLGHRLSQRHMEAEKCYHLFIYFCNQHQTAH